MEPLGEALSYAAPVTGTAYDRLISRSSGRTAARPGHAVRIAELLSVVYYCRPKSLFLKILGIWLGGYMPHQLHNFGLAAVDSAIADAEFAGYGMHLLTATSTNHLAHQPPFTLRT